jgi:hypothetical protein
MTMRVLERRRAWPVWSCYYSIRLEIFRKTTKELSRDNRQHSRGSNRVLPQNPSRALLLYQPDRYAKCSELFVGRGDDDDERLHICGRVLILILGTRNWTTSINSTYPQPVTLRSILMLSSLLSLSLPPCCFSSRFSTIRATRPVHPNLLP